jgi:DHA2 family multidrug resistance protein-like MFS transporter
MSQPSDAEIEAPNPRRWAILAVLVVSLLIVVLDNTVMNIALPTIQRDLGPSQSQLIWAIDAYVLVFAALLFTWGVLGDKYGRRRILLIGLTIFMIGSALCSISTSPAQLIGFRALMGIGGAAVTPVTLAIITVVFPPRERGKAIGYWAAAVGAGVALGPVLGGLLLQNPKWFHWLIGNDWGSVFLINVPIVIIGIIGIIRLVPESRNPSPQRLDVRGLLLSITGLTSMVYGIIHAGDKGDWLAPSVLLPIVGGVLILVVFVLAEIRSDHKSFDVTLFTNRPYGVSLSAVSLAFFALSGVTFTLPFFLQILRGYSTLVAGLCFLPFALGQIIAAPRSAKMVARFGVRRVITVGLSLVLIALILLSQLSLTIPLWFVLITFFIFGFGMGNVIAPASTVMQNALPLARAGAGSAVQNTVRQVFGAFGIAIIGTLLTNHYARGFRATVDALPVQVPQVAKDFMLQSVAKAQVAINLAQQHGLPAAMVEHLRRASYDSFIAASHITTWVSVGVILVAVIIVATQLPTEVSHSHRDDEIAAQEAAMPPVVAD